MNTSRQIEKEKKLRREIILLAKNDLHLSVDDLHSKMHALGFGSSLRKLNLSLLVHLKNRLQGIMINPNDSMDNQSQYICSLAISLGWSREQLYLFFAGKFNKSEFRYLSSNEKGALIHILKQMRKKDELA